MFARVKTVNCFITSKLTKGRPKFYVQKRCF
nr:MAG TPA: hypothetical protein [Caudoviricetes sp.]